MAGYKATSLNFQGYPGHIMLMKVRLDYGEQSHLEKRRTLHSWYSDLRAYLPMLCKTVQDYTEKKHWNQMSYFEMMEEARKNLHVARVEYSPTFEGIASCTEDEKKYEIILEGIQELLDEITAIAKIIDKAQLDEEGFKV